VDHICPSQDPSCVPEQLCSSCLGQALAALRPQARVAGAVWCESVCRRDARARAAWPAQGERVTAIAVGKVASLARDERLHGELARAAIAGAVAWWERRPGRYRA